jgi:predicted Co/Zn/Cd cation transporter (cation efflux family)
MPCRRVKRLKKLSRMFSSGIAQAATNQWKHHTLFLLAIILIAHIACFAVVTTQLDARHA